MRAVAIGASMHNFALLTQMAEVRPVVEKTKGQGAAACCSYRSCNSAMAWCSWGDDMRSSVFWLGVFISAAFEVYP